MKKITGEIVDGIWPKSKPYIQINIPDSFKKDDLKAEFLVLETLLRKKLKTGFISHDEPPRRLVLPTIALLRQYANYLEKAFSEDAISRRRQEEKLRPKTTKTRLACPFGCEQTFKNKLTLSTHKSQKHQTKCYYCGQEFQTPQELTNHKRGHRPDASFKGYAK